MGHSTDPDPKPNRAARLKDLYRALVRRLHPDSQVEMTPQKTEWWHQAQAAYQIGDPDELELILTLCEIGDTGTTAHTSASMLQRVYPYALLHHANVGLSLGEDVAFTHAVTADGLTTTTSP